MVYAKSSEEAGKAVTRVQHGHHPSSVMVWGIPGVSKDRKERIKAITNYLCGSGHNIVCLQEVWSESDYFYLKDNLKEVLPYSHYFYSGVLGSGLCVLSKWVIKDVFFHQWPLNGYIHKIHHGDWFGGKGVGYCRIKCNDSYVNIYCTHLHAEYNEDDIYLAHRVLQAYCTAEFINITKANADICILSGDLNAGPEDLSFKLLRNMSSLVDPYDLEYENDDVTLRRASGTSNNSNNSYSDIRECQKNPNGKRIDHILFHADPNLEVNISNFGNPLEDRVPGQIFSYSDHNAVSLQLHSQKKKNITSMTRVNSIYKSAYQSIEDAIKVCEEAQISIARSRKIYLSFGGVLFMLLIATVGYWPNNLLCDIVKIVMTWLCFYYLMMGSLWCLIEINSIKAALSGLNNCKATYDMSPRDSGTYFIEAQY